ncbi:hypothetical protein HL666_16130 [Bradyrhizobium sp. 83002]|uniref:hypothetical protein n=1 Tax=Bradyrhizobium aeschynomenes TaxID=2734909 RepID=UPI0015555BA0|nr:hypothetical protein [Bradyrhizobium aeschynomenes]NPU12302.1 hypothetical protein [Bradyrhizobium aeschynomenes]
MTQADNQLAGTQKSAVQGCLKSMMVNVLILAFMCGAWYFLFGDEGILAGIASFLAIHLARFFAAVFGNPPQVPSLREPDRDKSA